MTHKAMKAKENSGFIRNFNFSTGTIPDAGSYIARFLKLRKFSDTLSYRYTV